MEKDLSVIILSYNTEKITKDCLDALINNLSRTSNLQAEIIVIDNASHDGSVEMLKKFNKKTLSNNLSLKIIFNKINLGFTKGNNQGIKLTTGKYILLLNSDAIVKKINFTEILKYLEKQPKIGALTVKVLLPTGGIDPASHRGFPTVWRSFSYFFKLEKIFGKIPLLNNFFGGYHLTHLDLNREHEIDSPTGAFYLTRKSILTKLKGFDETFFMYGEDLDLSMRIKKLGFKIVYYPKYEVLHLKHRSGIKNVDVKIKKSVRKHFYESMKIFYRKHYEKDNPALINYLVYLVIDIKKKLS